jgi:Tfp pilus assembly protein PilE
MVKADNSYTRNKSLRNLTIFGLVVCAFLSFTPWLDSYAEAAIGSALSSTLKLFASVRGVDAIVSAAEGTELSIAPVGVGVTFAPGELVEPIDDLVERLGDVLLWVLTLLGVEKLSLGLLGSASVRLLSGTVFLAASAFIIWWPAQRLPARFRTLLVMLILIRIGLPLAAIASEALAQHVVDARTASAESALVSVAQKIEQDQAEQNARLEARVPPASVADEQNILERINTAVDDLGNAIKDMRNSLDLQASMEQLSQRMEAAVNHVVDLLALVTLRALLFPALFLFSGWLLLRLAQ